MEVAKTFGPCRICGEPTRHIGGLGRGYVHMVCYAEECDRVRRAREAYERGEETRRMKSWRAEPPASMPDNVSHTPAPVYSTLVDALRSYGEGIFDEPSQFSALLRRSPR